MTACGPYKVGPDSIPMSHRLLDTLQQGSRALVGYPVAIEQGCCLEPPVPPTWMDAPAAYWGFPGTWSRGRYTPVIPELDVEDLCHLIEAEEQCHRPDALGGRVRYFDKQHRVDMTVNDSTTITADGVYAVELVRVPYHTYGTGVLERIATWARLDFDGGNVIEVSRDPPTFGAAGEASPYPYPLLGVVTISHELVLQRVAENTLGVSVEPNFAAPAASNPNAIIPWDEALIPRWSDSRYVYGHRYTEDHHWVVGSRSILRLFAIVTVDGLGNDQSLEVSLAGRLSGYWTRVGRYSGAVHAATRRN